MISDMNRHRNLSLGLANFGVAPAVQVLAVCCVQFYLRMVSLLPMLLLVCRPHSYIVQSANGLDCDVFEYYHSRLLALGAHILRYHTYQPLEHPLPICNI